MQFHGVSGGTLGKQQEKIRSFCPNIIIVKMGGNDLCIPNTRPEMFAWKVKKLM